MHYANNKYKICIKYINNITLNKHIINRNYKTRNTYNQNINKKERKKYIKHKISNNNNIH